MKKMKLFVCLLLLGGFAGCASNTTNIKKLKLGMKADEVYDKLGEPTSIRAAKIYDDGQTTEVWEYVSRFSINPDSKKYWIFFFNGQLVQWGEPGDFAGKRGDLPVMEYVPVRDMK